MSKLKKQIAALDEQLDRNMAQIREEQKAFEEHPSTGIFMSCTLAGGFVVGMIAGKTLPLKWSTLMKVPMKIGEVAATTKLVIDKINPLDKNPV